VFNKRRFLQVALFVFLLGLVATVPVFAGSAVIGSVAGSINATVGGQTLMPNTAIFSGDSLQVKEGVAVVAVGNGSRMVFGRETSASFLRDASEVTVLLSEGNVSVFHPNDGLALRVKAGDISVVPAKGFKTLGEVAMLNGSVIVTAKEGMLRVEGNGPAVEVAKGKTITLAAKVRAPQGAAAGAAHISTSTALQVAGVATGVTSTVLSGVSISRANDAKSAAASAATTASNAVTAANDATAAAEAAQATANSAGCALNNLAVGSGITTVSPYTPPTGSTCE
jgi:hypothetical protein